MIASQAVLDTAARMGARRGQLFHDTGIPTRCPFVGDALADVAAAWADAYLETIKPQILTPAGD